MKVWVLLLIAYLVGAVFPPSKLMGKLQGPAWKPTY